MNQAIPSSVMGKLREAFAGLQKSSIYQEIVDPKDQVLARFQPAFSSEHIPHITKEEFQDFLLFKRNHHWTGLHRQGPKMCSDMEKLRKGLAFLVDDNLMVAKRLDKANSLVSGMGKNVASAILLIIKPDQYGVWNRRSEDNLKRLDIFPRFERGESFGNRYVKINEILLQISNALSTDLWTLDALWYYIDEKERGAFEASDETDGHETSTAEDDQRFGLERHLHEFLRDNWDRTELGQDWEIYQEPGDDEAGYEYQCGVGRIDLLAKHRQKPRWLVIELKRNQTSDQTVGQILRYMGWIRQHVAEDHEQVKGLIICRDTDLSLQYALSQTANITVKLYQVNFQLNDHSPCM